MSEISVQQACKGWGATKAVDTVSFEVRAGSLVVLLGPSGCGKSTTLRLIAGLETADSGRILIGGRDVTFDPPAKRRVSMVFQSYALFPHLSVSENLVFGLKVRKVPATERAARLKRVAELLGLDQLLERKPSQLSGGQQQRVALGRAIIAQTPVCLMDEPLSNLDAQLRNEMRREIRALQQKLGITMVYVTHDQTEAMSMADQVILLNGGHIEQDAPPAELYAHPATVFAARFIGTPPMNIIDPSRIPAAAAHALAASTDDGALIGVRPEDITIVPDSNVAAHVTAIEYLGADSIIACALGMEPIVVRAQGRVELAVGAEVGLAWAPQVVHRFDAASGRRTESRNAPAMIRAVE
ncbi:MAG TPA: ABC transporter ATP-binding protein [Burkholderiales bacterium]|nr:ABC transporter ATP-binding protein [Burkholderiales bacterium]